MAIKYQKYDPSFKLALVEEYYEEYNKCRITKSEFAHSKGISDSTFNDWCVKYIRDKDRYFNTDTDIVEFNSKNDSKFIKLSEDNIVSSSPVISAHECKITLKYKDVLLEFNSSDLNRVMEIIRRW